MSEPSRPPILVVHGIWDSQARVAPLTRGLLAQGLAPVESFDLKPNTGRATMQELAEQVRARVASALMHYDCKRVDLVGFSMGALAARYYLQRGGGKRHVRRFVSISGPHAGTLLAYLLPLPGVRQMRPGSALLRELAADPDPWGEVEVHCIYTPFDLTIVPPRSSELPGARSTHTRRVPLHRLMLYDRGVHELVARLLREP